jgi:thiol:disulfide interchange protein DsbD
MNHSFNIQRLLRAACFVAAMALVGTARADDFLEADQAFKLTAQQSDNASLTLSWVIAPGYKLYRDRLKFTVDGQGTVLEAPSMPAAERVFDVGLEKDMYVFHKALVVGLKLKQGADPFTLHVGYQGCADAGLCYPPVEVKYRANPAQPGLLQPVTQDDVSASAADDSSLVEQTLSSGNAWRIGLAFLVFGLLLSLTPCVLPMIPILSSIIVGEGAVSRSRGLALSLAYSLGMALVYTAMGVGAGLAGAGVAAALQKPWVLVSFATVLLVLSLSMFDVYQLQLPSSLQSKLNDSSGKAGRGRFVGVFIMGALSALIVGPCVAAPLAGALLYISQTRNVWTGGWALFSMAMGMSVPLLLTGVSAGSLLPRAGAWMNGVKRVFGLLLIATALWMLVPILPTWGLMLAVGAYAFLCAACLHLFDGAHPHAKPAVPSQRFARALGLACLLMGVFQFVGVASGGTNVLRPLEHLRGGDGGATLASRPGVEFKRITSLQALEAELMNAKQPVMLDFYADWCVSCKEMEKFTFANKEVAQRMGKVLLLQADVTANNQDDQALMKKFSLFGPPAIALVDKGGQEVSNGRVIGYMDSNLFLQHLALKLRL